MQSFRYTDFYKHLLKESKVDYVNEFVQHCKNRLKIQTPVKVEILNKGNFDIKSSAGGYYPADKLIKVQTEGRAMPDYLRSLAHEMVHHKQNELNVLGEDSGKTGSKQENQANTIAGILMREFSQKHPEIYE